MNNMKKTISTALALIIAASAAAFAAACGESADPAVDTTAAQTDLAPDTEAETTDYLSTLPENNFEGRSFTIVAQNTEARQNFPLEDKTGDSINDALIERDRMVEEKLGIKFNLISYEDRGKLKSEVQKTILAGDSTYDLILTCLSDGINTLGPAGTLYDLNTVPYLSLTAEWWNKSIHNDLQILGKQLFSTGPISPQYYMTPIVMVFNKRLAEDYGMGNLYAMVNEGQWYFDKFISMVNGLSYDMNSDGKMNMEDFYGFATDTTFGNAMYAAAGLYPVSVDGDVYTMNIDSKESIDMIMKCAEIFSDKSQFIITEGGSEGLMELFKYGQCVFRATNILNIVTPFRDMEDDYGVIPLPKYNESDSDYFVACNTWLPTGAAVPITCTDPEFVGQVMETMAYISWQTVGPATYEVTLRGKATRDSESYEMLEMIFRNVVFDFNTVFNFGGSSELLRAAVCGLKPNFISNYEKMKPKAQKALDEMIALVSENYG